MRRTDQAPPRRSTPRSARQETDVRRAQRRRRLRRRLDTQVRQTADGRGRRSRLLASELHENPDPKQTGERTGARPRGMRAGGAAAPAERPDSTGQHRPEARCDGAAETRRRGRTARFAAQNRSPRGLASRPVAEKARLATRSGAGLTARRIRPASAPSATPCCDAIWATLRSTATPKSERHRRATRARNRP